MSPGCLARPLWVLPISAARRCALTGLLAKLEHALTA
jgi:hypothetical protein